MVKKIVLLLSTVLLVFLIGSCGNQDPFENSIYSEQPAITTYQDYLAENGDLPSEGIDPILKVGNEKNIIEKDGFQFKDSDGNGELNPYEDWRLSPADRAADLASKMTWEQKLGLLSWGNQRWTGGPSTSPGGTMWYGVKGLEPDGSLIEKTAAETIVAHGQRYSNLNLSMDPIVEATFLNNIQGLVERLEWGIPFFWCAPSDYSFINQAGYELDNPPTNKLSPWPFALGFGAADDLAVTRKYGDYIRQELRMRGRHAMWGPVADSATEPRWSRVNETIHAESDVVADHIEVLIKALQSSNEDKNNIGLHGIIAFVKHFPGMGPDEEGMDSHTYPGRYNSYPGDNFDSHLKPFRAAITEAHAGGVMIGYSIVDTDGFGGVAAAYDPAVYELLYSLGFDGDITTDNNPGAWGVDGQEDLSLGEKAAMILKAGANHWLGGDYLSDWNAADKAGLLNEEDVNRAVTEALKLQFKLGLFENPYVNLNEARKFWDPEGSDMKDHVAAGKMAMQKAMVLVKNDQFDGVDVLPVVQRNTEIFDTNGNGIIDVYFDSVFDGYDSGKPDSYANAGKYPNRNFVSDITDADVAIIRIFSRGGIYFGTEGGVPLSFDGKTYRYDRETGAYTNEEIQENSFTGAGDFRTAPQKVVGGVNFHMERLQALLDAKAANPNLKIIVGITAARPVIVEPLLDKIDGLIIDFGATDDTFLDMVCFNNGLKPTGTLPIEFPSNDASVVAQFEDIPGDTKDPTFEIGFGLEYAAISGYGN